MDVQVYMWSDVNPIEGRPETYTSGEKHYTIYITGKGVMPPKLYALLMEYTDGL